MTHSASEGPTAAPEIRPPAQAPGQVARRTPTDRPPGLIGWMECVDLPDLDLGGLKVKIDTGARTSALHATRIEHFDRDGALWVRFRTRTASRGRSITREAPVANERWIKNTSGIPQLRIVIRTRMRIGKRLWTIDLSLADRTNMTFPMIVGRAALKNHAVAVHPRKAYLLSDRPASPVRKDKR